MQSPLALKINDSSGLEVYMVSLDPNIVGQLVVRQPNSAPAILVARSAEILPAVSAGIIDGAEIIALQKGNWAEAILVIMPEAVASIEGRRLLVRSSGDTLFLAHVRRSAPALAELCAQIISAIRDAGIEGDLVERGAGRWVNSPLNTFTLKAQPRAGNLAFTLYGNPETFNANGFLLKDQNSYSRGWISNSHDVGLFTKFALQSHARRKR
jgi:hypothetical protein